MTGGDLMLLSLLAICHVVAHCGYLFLKLLATITFLENIFSGSHTGGELNIIIIIAS